MTDQARPVDPYPRSGSKQAKRDYYERHLDLVRAELAAERERRLSLEKSLAAMAQEWDAKASGIKLHHATMGTGFAVCATELEQLLERTR